MSKVHRARALSGGASRRVGMSVGSFAVATAVCAFALCGSALASPSPLWEVNGKHVEANVTIASKGTFRVTHNPPHILSGGSFTAECVSSGEQIVGPNGEGEIKTRALSGCKVLSSTNPYCTTTTAIEIKSIALPWHTQLGKSGGATRDYITKTSSGEPGIELKCGAVKAATEGNTSTAVKTVAGGVDETFDSGSEGFTSWNDGGTGGKPEGTQLLESPSGGALAVALLGEWLKAEKPLTGTEIANSSGSVKLLVAFQGIIGGGASEIGCNESGKGTVGPGGEAEVTSTSLTGCEVIREVGHPPCTRGLGATVRGLELPWHTLLYSGVGATREYGSRAYEIVCDGLTVFGTGQTSTALETTGEGVNQIFDAKSEPLVAGDMGTGVVTVTGSELLKVVGLSFRAGM